MSQTGRFWITDHKTGRRFCVEPISERSQPLNAQEWEAGGAEFVGGGAIRREDSIITEENGFTGIVEFRGSVMDQIQKALENKETS
jgi:hypothetical protein